MERLDKNFLWLSAANIIGSLFTILLFIYLARVLGAECFGYLSYATTIVVYLFNFIDLGLSTYGIREVAKERSRVSSYVSSIVSFKLAIATVLFTGIVLITFSSNQAMLLKILISETALMLFVSACQAEWAFQGMEKMHMIFISMALTTFLQLFVCLLAVSSPADTFKVPIISFLASLPIILIFLRKLRFKLNIIRIDLQKLRLYLSSSLVIWAISVFTQTYNGLDIVIMGFFRTPEEVGYFTVARRITGGLAVLMIFLANAALPRLSRTFVSDITAFRRATRKFLMISILMAIFVFLPIIFFSDKIISLTVGSEYLAAAPPLRVMAMALVLVMFNMPYSTGLIAACFEKAVLKQAAASAALSIILNFILIPRYGMMGASISFLFAELLALVWILRIYHRRIRLKSRKA